MSSTAERAYQRFMDSLAAERGASPHTLDAYGRDLQEFFAFVGWGPEPGTDQLRAVDHRTIRAYLGHLARRGYARRSVARKLSALRSFFRFCVRHELLAKSPLVHLATPKRGQQLPVVLDLNDVQAILAAPARDTVLGRRDRALLELLYATGIRLAEVVGLDVSDLELPAVPGEGGLGRVWVRGKGGKERVVPVGRAAVAAVDAYLRQARPYLLQRRGVDGISEPAVFLSRHGRRLSRRAVEYLVQKYARQAGVPQRVTTHTFRHSFATHVLDGGADLRSVQEMLGHANISTTQVYTHVTPERLRRAYQKAHPRA